jgi:hypothetical protein
MTILWVDVPDPSSASNRRAFIERNAIALLSNGLQPVDSPSAEWLGRYSHDWRIQRSGLWNLDHVVGNADPDFLDVLEAAVDRTLGGAGKH